jgi:hypothetical protein
MDKLSLQIVTIECCWELPFRTTGVATLRFAFMPSMCNVGYCTLIVFLCCHYMFWPNRPSSGVQIVVIKKSIHLKMAG